MAQLDFFTGRRVFIAGASGGLGAALVEKLCARQVAGLMLSARRCEVLIALQEKATVFGVEAKICPADCSDAAAWHEALQAGLRFGCDIFILAMGTVPAHARDALESSSAAAAVFAVNTLAPLQALYQLSAALPPGSAVGVISSQGARYPIPSIPLYGASKCALSYAVQALQPYFQHRCLKLSLIEPGFFDSPMGRRFVGRTWFKLSASEAAELCLRAIATGQTHAVFPLTLRFGIALLPWLPPALRKAALRYFAFDTTA